MIAALLVTLCAWNAPSPVRAALESSFELGGFERGSFEPGSFEQGSFEHGVEAYRRGDYAEARVQWQATLEEPLDALERARVYHDLGNAYWRLTQPLAAIACYTAAVRLDPRASDARANLELARAKANLPPADAGDLGATLDRALASLRPSEARLVLLAALFLWTLVLVFEVRLGGAWRGLLALASLGLLIAATPWAYVSFHPRRAAPMLVIENGNVSLRGEPLEARDPIGELSALEEVERLDELSGWVRVERADGLRGWVRSAALFPLQLENRARAPSGG